MNTESSGGASRILIERYNRAKMEEYCLKIGVPYRDFQETLGDQQIFARREIERTIEISPGVELSIKNIDLPFGFTVSYDLSWGADDTTVVTSIESKPKRFYLRHLLRNDPSILAVINGGFFFLADEAEFEPREKTLNLCIRNGEVVGLPSANREALLVQDGRLSGRQLDAVGKMVIGRREIGWVGANSRYREHLSGSAVLYNSACCASEHQPDPNFASGKKRVLTVAKNFTPKKNNVHDLVVNRDENDRLVVSSITHGGGTNFFDGLFILQITGERDLGQYRSAHVIPTYLDDITLGAIDSAVTIGPSIHHFRMYDDHDINHDISLGSLPPFARGRRKARSVIYKKDGIMHMRVFDGAPFTTDFKGVTVEELSSIIGQEGFEWGFHSDPGHSARIVARTPDSQIHFFGSKQKFLRPKNKQSLSSNKSLPKLWNAANGTPVSSAIVIRRID